jgi:16S rRNA (uracil1498-N3)-methyltransferase
MPRLFVDALPGAGELRLADAARRHLQVLRLRAGDALTLFDGRGGEWQARVIDGDRVELLGFDGVERELARRVVLAIAMPANERMDWLVEKATELGVDALQPLHAARSVLRLHGARAQRRLQHWQAIATSACEQCGRNRVPRLLPVASLADWLAALAPAAPGDARCLLAAPAQGAAAPYPAWRERLGVDAAVLALSGPEGGFDATEIELAQRAGFTPLSLGARVLRAETAPLALLAALAVG